MTIDTIVIGESVGSEMWDLIDAGFTGHRVLAILHSENAEHSLLRALSLAKRANVDIGEKIIKDSIDITNTATYNALSSAKLGKNAVDFDSSEVLAIYGELLAKNLNLNDDFTPKPNSVADDKVTIDSLILYTSGIPTVCPNGSFITRPTIHSCITVPVRSSLYRSIINGGKPWLLKAHVDSELPVDN